MKTYVNTGHTLILVAASTLLLASVPLRASQMDDRIESSAKKSYVFKHYLPDDAITIESKNGAVTLTGTVAE
jgi:osmotically-inducible protein OsmY